MVPRMEVTPVLAREIVPAPLVTVSPVLPVIKAATGAAPVLPLEVDHCLEQQLQL